MIRYPLRDLLKCKTPNRVMKEVRSRPGELVI